MATALKLRSDIKKLKKGLEAKGVSASLKEKLKSQLKKAEDELESLKKTGKAPKKSSVGGTKVALTALQKLIQRKKYGVYQGAGVDLKKDAGEGALATGRRVSKGLKSNQNGDKSDNKGNVYYEYRPNRLDVKQPKKRQTYPKLEDGGMMAKGGITADDLIIGKSYKYDYAKDGNIEEIKYLGTKEQLVNKGLKNKDIDFKIGSGGYVFKFDFGKIIEISKSTINKGVIFASGGYMADGGEVGVGDKVIFKDNKYRVSKITNENVGGFIDTKWHLDSTKIGVKDVVLDSPKGITKISDSEYMANSGYMADGGQTQGKNGYVAFYKGKRIEVYADTMYQAQLKAAKIFNAKKSYEVNVVLAEVDGKQYYNSTMADGGMMAKGGEIIFLKSVGTYFRPSDMTVSPMEDFENEGEITSIKDVDEEWVEKLSAEDNKIIFDKMLSKHFKQSREMADGGEIKNIGYAITEETGIKKNDGIEYGSVSRKDVESVLKKEKNKLLKYKGRFARDSHQNIPLFDEIISDLKNDGWRIVDTRKDKMSDGGMMAKGGEVKYKDVDGIERSINFVKEENRLSYYDDIRERKEIAAFINDSSKIVTPSGSNVFPNPIAKAVIKWSKKNGYKFIQDDKEYADGGMMAMGGLTEHGLKIGDLVESQEGDYITVKNNNKFYVVDLNSGYRTMGIKNGGIMEGNVMSTTHRMSK